MENNMLVADAINRASERIEFAFNVAGSVPVYGRLASMARITAGIVQVVAGLIFTTAGVFSFAIATIADDEGGANEAYRFMGFGLEYMGHGFLNEVRAILELVSQVSTLGIATLLYNISGADGEQFEPSCKYTKYPEYAYLYV
jgi:hypothetical protein